MNTELTANILQARENLERRLSDIGKISEINELIMLVVEKNLESIKQDLESIGRGGGTMKKIDHALAILATTTSNPQVMDLKKIIREQIIVLYMGSLESFLSDAIRIVGNTKPNFFKFKSENENITFNQAMLQNNFTLGDAILEHIENKKYSFQDLKSTLDVFENYLDISLDVDEYKDQLILMAASRHIIVHNSSVIDRRFLKQIRDTPWAKIYKLDKSLEVEDTMISEVLLAVQAFSDQIVAAMISRDDDLEEL